MDQDAVQAIINALANSQTGKVVNIEGAPAPIVIVPNGHGSHRIENLEQFIFSSRYRTNPFRMMATVNVNDPASFVEYYQKFSDDNSRVFASIDNGTIKGILDYHGAGSDGAARWGDHVLTLKMLHSPEWVTWVEQNNGTTMAQADFANFIQHHQVDIIEPSGGAMLDIATDLQATINGEFGAGQRLESGATAFKFTQEIRATSNSGGGQIEIPPQFKIRIPIFQEADPIEIVALLRYRLSQSKLVFWYDLVHADRKEREAFEAIRSQVAKELGIFILNGQSTMKA